MPQSADFFAALVPWQRQHGRHGLPWQGSGDPYRVWLSEIMLQQTQVSTVLDYYPRFLQRFPDVHALAQAELDDVLALWSGLGYYSRARNLHRCAQQVVQQWGGRFPATAEALQTLHGIGPSTAAAIAAFCFGERISILDGNVKRVLTRWLAFAGDLAESRQERRLWQQAQALLPPAVTHPDMVAYTQGLMDLGATVCTRTRPKCTDCPVAMGCLASQQGRATDYPVKTRKLKRSVQEWWLLVWRRHDGAVWLQQRPERGIWAGLYSLPVYPSLQAMRDTLEAGGGTAAGVEPRWHDVVHHSLTHRDLVLRPVEWPAPSLDPAAQSAGVWVRSVHDLGMGLPAPVRSWLQLHLPG